MPLILACLAAVASGFSAPSPATDSARRSQAIRWIAHARDDAAKIVDVSTREQALLELVSFEAIAGQVDLARKAFGQVVSQKKATKTSDADSAIACAAAQLALRDVQGAATSLDQIADVEERGFARRFVLYIAAERGFIEAAKQLFDFPPRAEGPGRADGAVAIARALAATGDVAGAKRFIDTVSAETDELQHMLPPDGYRAIAMGQLSASDTQGAWQTAQTIRNPFWRTGTLAAIAEGCAQRSRVDEAVRAADAITDWEDRAEAYALIAAALARNDNKAGAQSMLDQCIKIGGGPQQWAKTSRRADKVGIAFAEVGDFKNALAVLDFIKEPERRPTYVAELAAAHARFGDVAAAKKLLGEVPQIVLRRGALEAAVKAKTRTADCAQAGKLADELSDDPMERNWMYAAICKAEAEKGSGGTNVDAFVSSLPSPEARAHALIGAIEGTLCLPDL